MNRILVPTDFSNIAANALNVALDIAEKSNAEIYLLNVIEPLVDAGFSASGSLDFEYTITEEDRYIYELHAVNEKKLAAFAARYARGNVDIFPTIAIDKVGDGVLGFMKKHKIDLVVMGTSGENTFEEYFIGNHTEQVMREANRPVLAIRNQIDKFKMENVVIATDLKTNASECMSHLLGLFNELKPQIHLLHISRSNSISVKETDEKITRFAKKHQLENYTSNVIRHNKLKMGIQRFASEMKADMIVTFTHGRKGLAHFFKGSISEDLVRQAKVPVLSVHMD